MRQSGAPDHEIAGARWNFDNVMPSDINWGINEWLMMGA
jgi:hypothetical protein